MSPRCSPLVTALIAASAIAQTSAPLAGSDQPPAAGQPAATAPAASAPAPAATAAPAAQPAAQAGAADLCKELLAYAEKVVAVMAKNRDIRPDDAGNPCCSLRCSGEDAEAVWLHFTADFSAIGMAVDMPLIATAYADENCVEWNFGVTPLGKTPRTATPEEAADALGVSRATAYRDWGYARAWLTAALSEGSE